MFFSLIQLKILVVKILFKICKLLPTQVITIAKMDVGIVDYVLEVTKERLKKLLSSSPPYWSIKFSSKLELLYFYFCLNESINNYFNNFIKINL